MSLLPPEVVAELERRADEAPELSDGKRAELRALMQPTSARIPREPERRAS